MEMAEKMVAWAVRTPADRVLDPSFGGLVFLQAGHRQLTQLGTEPNAIGSQLYGCDLDQTAHAAAGLAHDALGIPEAQLIHQDFFAVEPDAALPRVEAVVGNPPYVRYQLTNGSGDSGRRVAAAAGIELTRLSSLWAPFTIHAADFVAPGGRMALVLPAELLHAQYAIEILNYVQSQFARTALVMFEERVFPGALEEVVLLFAEGRGEGECEALELVECNTVADLDIEALKAKMEHRPAPAKEPRQRSDNGKLMGKLLPAASRDLLAELSSREEMVQPLGAFASVDIGAVTGANDFFLLAEGEEPRMAPNLLHPAISKAAHVQGALFQQDDLDTMRDAGKRYQLFIARNDVAHGDLKTAKAYLARGEAREIPGRYKCRIRNNWWSVPLPKHGTPDLFLTYFASEHPRMVVNQAGALHTNTVHGVSVDSSVEPRALAAVFYNSLSLLSAELVGRSYGGGVLKLEPTEAERVLIPAIPADASERVEEVDQLVRAGNLTALLDYVDRWLLIDGLGLSATEVAHLRAGGERLRSRRRTRGKAPA